MVGDLIWQTDIKCYITRIVMKYLILRHENNTRSEEFFRSFQLFILQNGSAGEWAAAQNWVIKKDADQAQMCQTF